MAQSKKSRILTASVASILAAAVLVGGGTFSYLQDETDDVVNEFNANQVTVDLTETGDGQYEIIPGTEEAKDPRVTVNATVDSYVYVVVTDNTDGLVTYEIADGWEALEGYEGVYYREVAADAETKEFYVLDGNTVSYDAALENTDMVDAEGNLKEGLALTFKAYAIQKQPFTSVEEAAAAAQVPTVAASSEEVTAAITEGKPVVMTGDVEVTAATLNDAGEADIDLNGNELTVDGSTYVQVGDGETFTLKNGTVNWANNNTSYISVRAGEGSTIAFEDVEMDMGGKSILIDYGTEAARIDVIDSEIYTTDYYCISTNASDTTSGQNVEINVINSTLTANDPNGDCTAILMNVPGTLTVENSEITAGRQAVIVRTGEATIKDSTLNNTLAYTEANWAKYDNAGWGSGNEVPVAVLVVGDRSSSAYPWSASCTLENVELVYGKETDRAPIYAAAYDNETTTVSGVGEYKVTTSSGRGGSVTTSN